MLNVDFVKNITFLLNLIWDGILFKFSLYICSTIRYNYMATERILIVDDEETLCEVLKINLENEGYDVDTALSAEEALLLFSK